MPLTPGPSEGEIWLCEGMIILSVPYFLKVGKPNLAAAILLPPFPCLTFPCLPIHRPGAPGLRAEQNPPLFRSIGGTGGTRDRQSIPERRWKIAQIEGFAPVSLPRPFTPIILRSGDRQSIPERPALLGSLRPRRTHLSSRARAGLEQNAPYSGPSEGEIWLCE
jgi:hypothetical protein